MAVLRNVAGDARDIPLAGGVVEDGDTFTVDDDVFHAHAWPGELFEVVEEPKSRPPAEPDEPPAKNAKREAWVDYALARGADPAAVEGLTVAQLIDQYGQE